MTAGVTAVVVDDGLLAGIVQQAPGFFAFRTAANRHGERAILHLPSTEVKVSAEGLALVGSARIQRRFEIADVGMVQRPTEFVGYIAIFLGILVLAGALIMLGW